MSTEMGPTLSDCVQVFRRWLYLPDPGHLLVAIATVAANRGPGEPVWLLVVGGPSSGKTETIAAMAGEPDVHAAAIMTEAGLLSGTPKRERAGDASGGLLRSIGDFGIISVKDFGSVLSMNRDTRAALLAALREVFDGSWTRHIGTDGGRTLTWHGKVGLVGGVTSAIDTHHAVMASLGERFVLFRLPELNDEEQGRQALDGVGAEATMRAELSGAVRQVLGTVEPDALTRKPGAAQRDRLVALASLTARCRSAVERDSYSREIELVMMREGPARLAKTLLQLLNALRAIGTDDRTAWPLVAKVALDCIPPIRLAAVRDTLGAGETSTADLATRLGLPTQTARRSLEDLAAHGVLNRSKQGPRDLWRPSSWLVQHWSAAVPEMSDGIQTESVPGKSDKVSEAPLSLTRTHTDDFSGTHAACDGENDGELRVARLRTLAALNEATTR